MTLSLLYSHIELDTFAFLNVYCMKRMSIDESDNYKKLKIGHTK
jgi:hypothetical protein